MSERKTGTTNKFFFLHRSTGYHLLLAPLALSDVVICEVAKVHEYAKVWRRTLWTRYIRRRRFYAAERISVCNRKVRTTGYESSVIKERCTVELAEKIIRAAFASSDDFCFRMSFLCRPRSNVGRADKKGRNVLDGVKKERPRCGTKTIYKVVKPVIATKCHKHENKFK